MYVRNTNCHTGRVKHHMKQVYNVCVLLLVPKGSPKSQKLVIVVVKAPELIAICVPCVRPPASGDSHVSSGASQKRAVYYKHFPSVYNRTTAISITYYCGCQAKNTHVVHMYLMTDGLIGTIQ